MLSSSRSPKEIMAILKAASETGWVLEPEAKRIMQIAGLKIPRGRYVASPEQATEAAADIGYPVVAKVISPKVMHKSEAGGVAVNIGDGAALAMVYKRFESIPGFRGVWVEESVQGLELILGSKIDAQFGPLILLGMGGTGVEIYQDVALRMAPIQPRDVASMRACLVGDRLLRGYRGAPGVNDQALEETVMAFSALVMEIADHFQSIDLNPVICTPEACLVADARIIL